MSVHTTPAFIDRFQLEDIKSYILQPIGEAEISKKRLYIKQTRITKKRTIAQISKKLGFKTK